MAMASAHVPVRIEASIYDQIENLSKSLGISRKKCVEMLLLKSIKDLEKSKTLTITIEKGSKNISINTK